MNLSFVKYSSTGNDFVIVDNRQNQHSMTQELCLALCDRKLGVGADGVMFLENSTSYDFKMVFKNPDGSDAGMCGNGARAIVHFASEIFGKSSFKFEVCEQEYFGEVLSDSIVKIKMTDISDIGFYKLDDLYPARKSLYINTGVPHCVFFVKDVDAMDVCLVSKNIRNDSRFKKGSNVNFCSYESADTIKIRTYERGVEGETLSCGTGATAGAIALSKLYGHAEVVNVQTLGGELKIVMDQAYSDVYLQGPAIKIFEGSFLKDF